MKKHPKDQQLQLLFLLLTILNPHIVFSIDFLFNGFDSTDVSLIGNATIESRILTLTRDETFSIGRGIFPQKITAKNPNSSTVLPFSTSFIFAMAPYPGTLTGHGFVFFFGPDEGIQGSYSAQQLGLMNRTSIGNSRILGVEFDVFKNEEFQDINDNHVGIDVNSLVSVTANEAGYWNDNGENLFKKSKLNDGKVYQVWVDYADNVTNVSMAPVGMKRPNQNLLSVALNLSEVFDDEMYVGFTAATGALVQSHKIMAWSFSNTNSSLSDALITRGLPSFELPETPIYRTKGFIAGVTVGVLIFVLSCSFVAFLLIRRKRRIRREREEMEDWELEYWPHRIGYKEIDSATKSFSSENVIGTGGNGEVYKGILPGGAEVAVKRISHENSEGIRAFLAEISSLGRLKHRNLVGLRGWCKKEKGSLMLVYDYMENGSLDKRVFESCDDTKMLSFEERIKILKQVASAILYLHDGWESKVLHRDIKSSNVLLDKEMNARLGDFGLARMHDHDKMAGTTRVVGTVGYLAPEIVKSGRASTQSDVFGYGVLILEVICGRRPIEEGKPPLIDWVWEHFKKGELLNMVDMRLRARGVIDDEEAEKVLHLGLLCVHPEPNSRPRMRQVVKVFEGETEVEEWERDTFLLEKMKSWASYPHLFSNDSGSHPGFEEIRDGLSSNVSLYWSNTNVEGAGTAGSGNR